MMHSQEILGALQAGKISLEEAKKALAIWEHPVPEEYLQASEAGQASPYGRKEAIAIVGMSGKYPDARNLTEYWDNLVQAKNAIREIPLSRWNLSDYHDPNPAAFGKMYCKWLGALDEIEYFDPLFFQLSPAEAEGMDPQHRLFLEEGYKAFEDAGYSPGLLSNRKCGVYLGIMNHEYDLLLSQRNSREINILGTSFAIAAARIAYLLNLKGPAIAIDTACSSSLVATHLACQALWNQEIDMALVGGVTLYLTPGSYVGMCAAKMLSPDGQCKTFDASANGFVPGEGVGAVVLKRLADAEADHDQIYGVIIGSGINQDGATNGITAPSVKSQIDLEREIYEKYAINPASISYVEMHGTGTKLGDPIELEALATVFCEKTQRKQYCAIGSVKSNIGHTSAAAGVAGLQKVLLAMKYKKLVPTLHFEQPNEHFDFEASPFYVNTEVQDWKSETGTPLRAAVSSFGYSGTNAHLVVEEYLPVKKVDNGIGASGQGPDRDKPYPTVVPTSHEAPLPRSTETPILFVLSAKSEQQLKSYAQEMKRWIQAHAELTLSDIAFTLQVGRQAMDYRLAIEASSREVLLQRLERFVDNQASTGVHTAQVKKETNDATLFEADADGQSLLRIWCQKKDLPKIAQIWVRGVNVDWKLLYGSAQDTTPTGARQAQGSVPTATALPHRISLPTYPFTRKRYWVDEIIAHPSEPIGQTHRLHSHELVSRDYENKAIEFYTFMAEKRKVGIVQTCGTRHTGSSANPGLAPEAQTEYLTFCPFEEKVSGFSMSQVFLHPEKYPDELRWIQAKQTEMRQVLFCQEDFQQVHTLFDIGCGYGTDVIQVAALYPHITTHGFTITQAQAELGNQRIAALNLSPQAHIWQKDSSKDAFPAKYDLIIGIEVTFHIRNKTGLFHNIASSLNENGKVLLMDYIANLRGTIADLDIEISVPTEKEWLDLLTEHQLVIDEIIDVSPQIANFVDDPEVNENVKDLPRVVQDMYRSFANQCVALKNGWISYCLLKLKKDTQRSASERWDFNAHKIAQKTPYPQALAEMLRRGHIPYPPNPGDQLKSNVHYYRFFHDLRAIKDDLEAIFLTVLKLEPQELEEAETFQDLGISSVNAVQLLEAINEKYDLNLPTRIIFECTNIDALAEHIKEHLPTRSPWACPKGSEQNVLLDQETLWGKPYLSQGTSRSDASLLDLVSSQEAERGQAPPLRSSQIEETRTVLLTPSWKEEVTTRVRPEHPVPLPTQRVILLYDLPSIQAPHLQAQMASDGHGQELKVKNWHSSQSRREQRFQDAVVQLIQELQHLQQSRPARPVLIQVVVVHREEPSFLAALASVLKTTQQEYPKLRGQLIEVEGEPGEGELLAWLHENQLQMSQEPHILYRDGKRWVAQWQERPPGLAPTNILWKEGGCYLISGGAGGLGRLFVQEIAQQVQKATVILVGRSTQCAVGVVPNACGARDTGYSADPRRGFTSGICIDYQQVDVSDGPAVHALIQRVLQQYGHLDGIIHAAGVLRDSLLLNKTSEEVQAVLAPKVIGVELLDEASREIPLDFFILCSSLASVAGNVGQADYAAANAYLDAFAHARQAQVMAGQRHGETVSINWPLWEEGGMQIKAEARRLMQEQIGVEPMGTQAGMQSLYQALALGQAQVIVLHGDLPKIRERMLQDYLPPAQRPVLSPQVPEVPRSQVTQDTQTMGREEPREKTLHDPVISDDIAIIGLALRCAQAETQEEFWDLVSQGKTSIEDITQKEWLDFLQWKGASLFPTTEFLYRYGKMKNVECFDPLFFKISPHEAKAMDVSQRILLEECYKALEDAGYTPSSLSGQQVATVIGSAGILPGKPDFSSLSMLGSQMSILASRIAYFWNLKGPALAIDTACSSSLVAIDMACQHLKSHNVDLAIAGGITIYTHPGAFLSMRNAGMLSPTGECRPFDRAADGIVVGDGVGIVILKRLQDAERDGDHIYGLIQASGTNQDGQTSGITVPSFQSQSRLQETIYRRHHIDPSDLQYIEAHGTATKLGDPIEIQALTHAFNQFTTKKGFCAIGSLKANIGHTTAAAGVLSVIKVVLSLKHQQIPPSINFSRENEQIDFANSPVYVNTTLKDWSPNANESRLAAINSFGFSGTNAHVVISEYVAKPQRTGESPCPYLQVNEATPGVLILSAQTQEGLRMSASAIRAFLQKHEEINLADLLYSLQVGRASMSYRLALVVTSKAMLMEQLEHFITGEHTAYLNRWVRKINKKERRLGDTEEGQVVLQKLVQHKKLEKLAELWLDGNPINWDGLYPRGSVKRLPSLPNYPFARERYEISALDLVSSQEARRGQALSLPSHPDNETESEEALTLRIECQPSLMQRLRKHPIPKFTPFEPLNK